MSSFRSNSQSQVLILKKQLITYEKKQAELQNYILQLYQKLSKQSRVQADIQLLKNNESQIRDVLKLKVSEIEEQKDLLASQLKLTQQLLLESQKQIEQLRKLYDVQAGKSREMEISKRMENSRHSQNSQKVMLDQNYKISELTKQIEIMKQLHLQQISKIQDQYEKTIQKVFQEKSHLEKFMRMKDDERVRMKTPTFKDRKFSEDVYNKQLEKLFNKKVQQFQQQSRKRDQELLQMEGQVDTMKNKCIQTQNNYLQMTMIVRNAMEQIQTLKGQKDILEKTLDFSKKIAEQQRNQFSKMLQVERQNHTIQISEFRQSFRSDVIKYNNNRQKSDETRKICNFILTRLKVVHAFVSDLRKYFHNQHIEMKQMFGKMAEKLLSFLEGSKSRTSKESFQQYQNLIQKYKIAIKEKDKEILELRKSKFRYSKNIQYLNKILVDD